VGGICLNWGCIPTKALLRTSEIYGILHHLDEYGLSAKDISYDATKGRGALAEGGRSSCRTGVKFLAEEEQGPRHRRRGQVGGQGQDRDQQGRARPWMVCLAKHIILATGARARALPGLEPDGRLVWTYKEAMIPTAIPKSLLVVGSGAIGIEFASFYRTMGAEVRWSRCSTACCRSRTREVSAFARKAFEKQGIKILTSAKVAKLDKARTASRRRSSRRAGRLRSRSTA